MNKKKILKYLDLHPELMCPWCQGCEEHKVSCQLYCEAPSVLVRLLLSTRSTITFCYALKVLALKVVERVLRALKELARTEYEEMKKYVGDE